MEPTRYIVVILLSVTRVTTLKRGTTKIVTSDNRCFDVDCRLFGRGSMTNIGFIMLSRLFRLENSVHARINKIVKLNLHLCKVHNPLNSPFYKTRHKGILKFPEYSLQINF